MSDVLKLEDLPELYEAVRSVFAEKRDELCEMDANMGDGDLGITMNKGYDALPELIRANMVEGDISRCIMKAGMKMGSVVPSTMGTLMSSGIMSAGKALKDKDRIVPSDIPLYVRGFADGIVKRGKASPGDRTILDAIDAAASACERFTALHPAASFVEVMDAALDGAKEGVEATKNMLPRYGKAAVFADKAKGVADQGAVAGYYMLLGMKRYFEKREERGLER